jgi:hypothetical protein
MKRRSFLKGLLGTAGVSAIGLAVRAEGEPAPELDRTGCMARIKGAWTIEDGEIVPYKGVSTLNHTFIPCADDVQEGDEVTLCLKPVMLKKSRKKNGLYGEGIVGKCVSVGVTGERWIEIGDDGGWYSGWEA